MWIERTRNDGTIKREYHILHPIKRIKIEPWYYTQYDFWGERWEVHIKIFYINTDIGPKNFEFSAKEWENQGGE
jgi:hypothetical protein